MDWTSSLEHVRNDQHINDNGNDNGKHIVKMNQIQIQTMGRRSNLGASGNKETAKYQVDYMEFPIAVF